MLVSFSPFNVHYNPMRGLSLLPPLFLHRNWEIRRLNDLSQDKQLVYDSNLGSLSAKPAFYFSLKELLYNKTDFFCGGGIYSSMNCNTHHHNQIKNYSITPTILFISILPRPNYWRRSLRGCDSWFQRSWLILVTDHLGCLFFPFLFYVLSSPINRRPWNPRSPHLIPIKAEPQNCCLIFPILDLTVWAEVCCVISRTFE